ncbi:hypothetical protein niasHS_010698 [Heterodera schachtii]|uniref:Rhodanese domain-containing protein n=1 Tax=Heterodera schachtii TaxID=97005 RepID=A0ABD2IU96_HETSC
MAFPLALSLPLFLLFFRLISLSDCQRPSTSVQTPSDLLPDPSHVADPSLLPVHLQKPDYRPLLSGETERKKGGPKATMDGDQRGKASETVMNMGEGEQGTTEKPKEAEVNAKEAEVAQLAKEKEAEESAKEAEVAQLAKEKEAEESAKEAEVAQLAKEKEAEESAKEAEEKAKEAEAAQMAKEKEAEENAKEAEEKAKEAEAAQMAKEKEAEENAKQAEEKAKEAEAAQMAKEKEAEESAKEAEENAEETEEKEKEAEEKVKEAEEKAEEAEEIVKEAEEKAMEAEEKAKEAQMAQEKDAEEKQDEEIASEIPSVPLAADEPLSGDAVAALMEAMRSAKLLVQNITLVMPAGEGASLGILLNALIGSRSGAPSQANGLFPSLPPSQPALFPTASAGIAAPLFDPPLSPNPSFGNCRPITASQSQQFRPPPSPLLSVPSPINQPNSNFLVDVEQLYEWIKSGQNVKVIDASYETDPGTTDHVQFYAEYYANWDKLMEEKKSRQYARSHIPGAVPFNVNIATFPSWNERQALYPPDKFEQYMQRLGIDSGDRLVIYARGPLGGLLHAARVWFLLRTYGHEEVFVLDGGLDAWRKADLPANDAEVETELGNWKAHFRPELIVTFEQLTTAESDGFCILSRLNWFNFLDVRPRNEFFGLIGPQPFGPQRNRLPGSKPFPADELVQDGFLAPHIEIIRKLQQIGYLRGYQTIAMGNTADEASLALLALGQVQDTRAKLFNGGIEELRRRAPYLLNSKN